MGTASIVADPQFRETAMPLYQVKEDIAGFSCEAGSVVISEDGLFETDGPDIITAMIGHGLTVTEVDPEAPEDAPAAPKRRGRPPKNAGN